MKRLKEIREEQGLSIRELATLSGVAPSTISQVEQGKRKPHLTTKDALTTALNASRADMEGELEDDTFKDYELLTKLVPIFRGSSHHIKQLGSEYEELKSLFSRTNEEFLESYVGALKDWQDRWERGEDDTVFGHRLTNTIRREQARREAEGDLEGPPYSTQPGALAPLQGKNRE